MLVTYIQVGQEVAKEGTPKGSVSYFRKSQLLVNFFGIFWPDYIEVGDSTMRFIIVLFFSAFQTGRDSIDLFRGQSD